MRGIGWGLVAFALCNLLACNWSPWGPHLAETYALLYDYRPLLAHQDLTGLEAGTHDIEFGVYVPRFEHWSKNREQQLRNALHAAHVTTRTPAVTRWRFAEVPGREDMRRVHLEVDLDRPGAWVMNFSGYDVYPVASPIYAQDVYDVVNPETLTSSGPWFEPSVVLLTVGPCNHVSRVEVRADEQRVMRQLEFFFTEPVTQQDWSNEVLLERYEPSTGDRSTVEPQVVRFSPTSVVLDVPDWSVTFGGLTVSLGTAAGLAGGFGKNFTCEPSATFVDVGYERGKQIDYSRPVFLLYPAAILAFEDPK